MLIYILYAVLSSCQVALVRGEHIAFILLLLLFVYCFMIIFRVTVPFSELMSSCCPVRWHLT